MTIPLLGGPWVVGDTTRDCFGDPLESEGLVMLRRSPKQEEDGDLADVGDVGIWQIDYVHGLHTGEPHAKRVRCRCLYLSRADRL
jgi:hypothetical protein